MKRKQKEEIRAKTAEELAVEIKKKEEEIFKMRLEIKMGRAKNTSELKRKKDELAVLETFLQEKRLSQVYSSLRI